MIDDTLMTSAATLATVLWICGMILSMAFTALLIWIGYLIMRTAVKNGVVLAHEELDRRANERSRRPGSSTAVR